MEATLNQIQEEDEPRWIDQARQGSRESFMELVRRHQQAVRHCLARYVGDRHVVDDLAQEVFLAAFRGLRTLDNVTTIRPWLMGIARHLAISHLRSEAVKQRRTGGLLVGDLADWLAEAVAADDRPDDDESLRQRALLECVNALSSTNRQLIRQYYYDSVAAEEIAKRMQRNAGTIRMMLLRIRRALGECIRHKLGEREKP